jgi:hypothetical protein
MDMSAFLLNVKSHGSTSLAVAEPAAAYDRGQAKARVDVGLDAVPQAAGAA